LEKKEAKSDVSEWGVAQAICKDAENRWRKERKFIERRTETSTGGKRFGSVLQNVKNNVSSK